MEKKAFVSLVDALSENMSDFSHIDGITWLGEGEPITNKARRLLMDLGFFALSGLASFPL